MRQYKPMSLKFLYYEKKRGGVKDRHIIYKRKKNYTRINECLNGKY